MLEVHKTKTLMVNGEATAIDEEIFPLVELINSIPGIATFSCCQGHFDDPDFEPVAYVGFLDGCDQRRLMRFLSAMYYQMNVRWNAWGRERAKTWHPGREIENYFDFKIEMGDGWAMTWGKTMYPYVLKSAQVVAKQMKKRKA